MFHQVNLLYAIHYHFFSLNILNAISYTDVVQL